MDGFELAQRHYLHEVERQSDLNQAISVPLALIVALLTGIITMLTEVTWPLWWAEVTLITPCGVAIICLLTAITNLVRASVGYRYAHPGTIEVQFKWRDDLIANGTSRFTANEQLSNMLEKEYARCANVNAINNDGKAEYLERTRVYIIAAVCILALAATPYLIIKADKQIQSGERDPGATAARR